VITVCSYSAAGAVPVDNPADISELRGRDGRLLWVDLVEPTDADLTCVQEEFELHPLAMEDATKHGQRPKLERYPTHGFVVAYSANLAEVDLFVGPDWIVTIREVNADGTSWSLDTVRQRVARRDPGSLTVGELLYLVLDELVDGYFDAGERTEDEIENIETQIFAEEGSGESEVERSIQQLMFETRQELLHFRRAVVPMREVVASLLRKELPWIDADTLVLMQDVYDHVLRVVDQLDAQRELLGNAVDAHLALIANRQNQVMKKMTSWGAILLVSTLIAGIYGMNFEHMPELHWRYGYGQALGAMLLVTIGGYVYFRRKGWL
jgi:magnesium transporter